MAENKSDVAGTESAWLPDLIPSEFATMGKKSFEELAEIQTDLFAEMQQANLSWIDSMQKRVKLASEFGAKLTAARSVPETATAFQDWFSRRMNIAADDAQHILTDSQKIMDTGKRLLSGGWLSSGHSSGT